MKIASWNVNGIRACYKNGLMPWLAKGKYDVILLQEVRAEESQIPKDLLEDTTYKKYWYPAAVKKGYSGTALFSKKAAKKIYQGIGIPEFDGEGRILAAEFDEIIAVSAYFPNSQDAGKRVDYKIRFCDAVLEWLTKLRRRGKVVILGGDYNIAPYPIDLARPDENENTAGYLPEEREWMKKFLGSGWVDSFRYLHPETVKYSWWSMRTRARERNIGWRIDFLSLHEDDKKRIKSADIENDIYGSDHCPIFLEIK